MSDDQLDRNDLDIIRDFNDAAEGLEDRYETSAFITAGDRLARKLGILMERAGTGIERGELLESMAGVLDHFAKQPFEAQDSLQMYEMTTGVLLKLGESFVANLRTDTVPEFYKGEQLEYISGQLKSAAKIREDMADYFPNGASSAAIAEQGRVYRMIAEKIDSAVKNLGITPEPPPSSRPGKNRERPLRSRF